MPAFPRTILPERATPMLMPGALLSWGQTGKNQARSTAQVGRVWTETYPIFKADAQAGRALLAFINSAWRNGTSFTIVHELYKTPLGLGGGTARVNGANQLGTSLITDGWTGSDPVLRAGDIISVAGVPYVLDITADAPNLVAGGCTLTVNPPIFGTAPADNALITYTGVQINAMLAQEPQFAEAGGYGYIAGLKLVFRESP